MRKKNLEQDGALLGNGEALEWALHELHAVARCRRSPASAVSRVRVIIYSIMVAKSLISAG